METVTLKVAGLFEELDHLAVEKQLNEEKGVVRASANPASGSVTVEFDEAATSAAALQRAVNACGFRCHGAVVPRHLCKPGSAVVAAEAMQVAPAHPGHAHTLGTGVPGPAAPTPQATAPAHDEIAHEMGHGAGMDMQDIVRDMRNRFWIALVFAIPIFIYSPMGGMFTPPAPPFGLDLDLWLFVLASAAVLYPVWPFLVAAWRALKNGVLNMAVLVVLSVGPGYVFSLGSTFFFPGVQFYEAVAVLLVFILLGHWPEMRD